VGDELEYDEVTLGKKYIAARTFEKSFKTINWLNKLLNF
jgi:hypothetical protein